VMTLARVFVSDIVVRQLIMLVLCLAAIIWQVWVLPYESRGMNVAATFLLFSLFVITAAGFPGAIYGGVLDKTPSAANGNTRRGIETLFGIDQESATDVIYAADVVIAATMLITISFLVVMAACYVRLSCGWKLPRILPADDEGGGGAGAGGASGDAAAADVWRTHRVPLLGGEGRAASSMSDRRPGRGELQQPSGSVSDAQGDSFYGGTIVEEDGSEDEGDEGDDGGGGRGGDGDYGGNGGNGGGSGSGWASKEASNEDLGTARFSLQRMATSVLGALAPAGGDSVRFQRE
jgi:hypothetical protein